MPRKGTSYERELASLLWSKGWAVIRGPASGGGARNRVQPDLVAVKDKIILVIEVKKSKGSTVYLDPGQVLGLLEWAKRAGGHAWIALRIPISGWRFHHVDSLETTQGGRFKIAKPKSGLKLRDLLALYDRKMHRIDEFLGQNM